MKKLLLILSILTIPTLSKADDVLADYCPLGTNGTTGVLLSNIPLNASATRRTFTFGPTSCQENTASFTYAVFELTYKHGHDGNVVLTCTDGQTVATADKTPQVCSGVGTCTANDAGIFSKAVTANKKWSVRLGIRGYRAWSCVVSHSGSVGGSDNISITGYLVK